MPESSANIEFFDEVKKIADRLEVRVKKTHRWQSCNICHVADEVPVLDGFGPIGENYRSPDEYILQDSVIEKGTLLAVVMNEL